MKIGIIAPSPVPFRIGGAENLWWGLLSYLNQETEHHADLVKLPSREHSFWDLVDNYRQFAALDVSHFDLVISSKYPAWMVHHPRHVVYMLHRLRGLYDTYDLHALPREPDVSHPEVASLVRFLTEHNRDATRLDECFDRLDQLRQQSDVPADVFAFPGPLIRSVVGFLDDASLSPHRIEKYAAIAQTVKTRPGYFPSGADVIVAYPPSNLPRFEKGSSEYFFTIGRLDGAKRIDLIVEAMLRAHTNLHLKIAGTGPDEDRLKKLAGQDPRIEFLGFVNDSDVIGLYADALGVVYVPYQEDYGLVTIEAMGSGKPVLTTLDAGGPNEFIRPGETGYSVPPAPKALADRLDYMASHVDEMVSMAPTCQRQVGEISWEQVAVKLIGSTGRKLRRPISRQPRKITVATTFTISPPRGGGQSRIFYLYANLAAQLQLDVDIVTLADYGQPSMDEYIAPQVREIRVPKSLEHMHKEARLSGRLDNIPITDVVMPKLYSLSPQYEQALARSASNSDFLVASHPYPLPVLERVRTGQPLIYEAQDVEIRLKRGILPNNRLARYFLAVTECVERHCCDLASLIMTCSDEDSNELKARFAADGEKILLVPNGVDLNSVSFTPLHQRRQRKRKYLYKETFSVLFMGSWHGPNIEAALFVLDMAQQLPQVRFHILGSVSVYLGRFHFTLPPNVQLWGVVDDRTKDDVLSFVDLAINPMETGTGSNLKMLDYLAAGVPVLSTRFGARGLNLQNDVHIMIAPLIRFPQYIDRALRIDDEVVSQMIERARAHVVAGYSWEIIARQLSLAVERLSAPVQRPLAASRAPFAAND